jgi:hypothetical protein
VIDHIWDLIGHPIGRGLALRDEGIEFLRKDVARSEAAFLRCLALSEASGSHLTALKALIGLFHARGQISRASWETHVRGIQGAEHKLFFREAGLHLSGRGAFDLQR